MFSQKDWQLWGTEATMNTNNTSLREDRVQVLERSELSNKGANKMLRFFLQTGRAHRAQMSQSNHLASFPPRAHTEWLKVSVR